VDQYSNPNVQLQGPKVLDKLDLNVPFTPPPQAIVIPNADATFYSRLIKKMLLDLTQGRI
jgi:hypothetical protein